MQQKGFQRSKDQCQAYWRKALAAAEADEEAEAEADKEQQQAAAPAPHTPSKRWTTDEEASLIAAVNRATYQTSSKQDRIKWSEVEEELARNGQARSQAAIKGRWVSCAACTA